MDSTRTNIFYVIMIPSPEETSTNIIKPTESVNMSAVLCPSSMMWGEFADPKSRW